MPTDAKLYRQTLTEGSATTAAQSAPSASEGVDAYNFRTALIAVHSIADTTAYSLQIWIKINSQWVKVREGLFSGLTETWAESFTITGADRVFAQVSAFTGGGGKTLKVDYMMSGG